MPSPPEYNVSGIDYSLREHLTYAGPLYDFHSHVMVTRPGDSTQGPPTGEGPGASTSQAETMLEIGRAFGVTHTLSMCLPQDIPDLRARLDGAIQFNGPIQKRSLTDSDDEVYRLLDRYLELGARVIKFWSAPRGIERGLVVDAPWRIEAARRARAAGVRNIMVHVADPDVWFRTVYADAGKFGTKDDQYVRLERLMGMFPDMNFIGAHMGGDPERPEHLQDLFERYPNYHVDTSATKWVVREVSPRRDAIRALVCRFPSRFLFGTDLVTRHFLDREHYVSRYWCQRTLWESTWEGQSPIADPDYKPAADDPPQPMLRGLGLPADVLEQVYWRNAQRLLASE